MAGKTAWQDKPWMTADRIAEAGGNFEPQRTNNGVLVIEGLTSDMRGGNLNANSGAAEVFTLSIDTFPLPKQQNGIIEVDYLNEKRKVAGKVTVDDVDIVLKDFIDKSTALVLWAWRCQVYNPWTGQIGLAHHYKKKATAYIFGPEGSYIRKWELKGLWPFNMDPGEIDMAGEDILKITLSCALDKATLLPDIETGERKDILGNGGAEGIKNNPERFNVNINGGGQADIGTPVF